MFKIVYYLVLICLYPFYWYRFEGRENIPAGPCVLCGNHSTNIDAVFMVLANGKKGDYGFMAKEELFKVPVLRHIIRWLHAFPVKRGMAGGDMHAIRTGFSILRSGKKLLMFPEGTRVKNGVSVRTGQPVEPKVGAVLFALRGGVPLVPVYISEGRKLFRRNVVRIGQPYQPDCGSAKPTQEDYQRLTHELMDKIYALRPEGGRA